MRDKMRPVLAPEEIKEAYRVALSNCDGDKVRARRCLEWYLRGYEQGGSLEEEES